MTEDDSGEKEYEFKRLTSTPPRVDSKREVYTTSTSIPPPLMRADPPQRLPTPMVLNNVPPQAPIRTAVLPPSTLAPVNILPSTTTAMFPSSVLYRCSQYSYLFSC